MGDNAELAICHRLRSVSGDATSVTKPTLSLRQRDERLAHLDARRSVPAKQLGEPGPDAATLLRLLQSASRVPDHGKRVPFRFIAVSGNERAALGEAVAALTLARDPAAAGSALDKDRQRFSHAPLVVVVVAVLDRDDDKIPKRERLLTVGSVCFALLQAAQALGFGAHWLTGWPAYDKDVRRLLGMAAQERVAGFMHIGTAVKDAPERNRPDARDLLTHWSTQ